MKDDMPELEDIEKWSRWTHLKIDTLITLSIWRFYLKHPEHLMWVIGHWQFTITEKLKAFRKAYLKPFPLWLRYDWGSYPGGYQAQKTMEEMAKVVTVIHKKLSSGKEVTPEDLGGFGSQTTDQWKAWDRAKVNHQAPIDPYPGMSGYQKSIEMMKEWQEL